MKIVQLSKPEMIEKWQHSYLGYTWVMPKPREAETTCYVRTDLPPRVYTSVLAHEQQHAKDGAFLDGRVLHWEVRAWRAGFRADWRGFFQAIWMSVTDRERLRLYWQRVTKRF